MTPSFFNRIPEAILAIILFIGILIFHFFGLKITLYQKKKNIGLTSKGPLEGALLELLSLILAFTFNKSASNYDRLKLKG